MDEIGEDPELEEEEEELEEEPSEQPAAEEEREKPAPEGLDAEGLLEYLEGLTNYLPEQKKADFEESEMRLRLKALQGRLQGHPGLKNCAEQLSRNRQQSEEERRKAEERRKKEDRRKAEDRRREEERRKEEDRRIKEDRRAAEASAKSRPQEDRPRESGKAPEVSPERLEKTFSYLSQLSSFHPDPKLGLALGSKMRDILHKLHGD